jgi:gluconate 2-dehydrogenase gamma chain
MSLPALISSCRDTWERMDETGELVNLSPEEATELEAIVDRIIPTTDTPGAKEAGVIHFLDSAFGSFLEGLLDPIRNGLDDIASVVRDRHSESSVFSALSESDQIAVLRSVEEQSYFGLMQFATLLGMFSHPKHGGNRDKVGWKLLGFDDRHAWQPPFGHYVGEVHRG